MLAFVLTGSDVLQRIDGVRVTRFFERPSRRIVVRQGCDNVPHRPCPAQVQTIEMTELRVDGGAAVNDGLLQFQADLLGCTALRPQVTETTALGAAYLAGLAVGFWDSTETLACHWRVDRRFEPSQPLSQSAARRAEWTEAVNRSKGWSR